MRFNLKKLLYINEIMIKVIYKKSNQEFNIFFKKYKKVIIY